MDVVEGAVGGCEVDRHRHVDVPPVLQVVDEVWLLDDLEFAELDGPGNHRLRPLIDQLAALIFVLSRLALDLCAAQLDGAVEERLRVFILVRVEAEAQRVVLLVVAQLEPVDGDLVSVVAEGGAL